MFISRFSRISLTAVLDGEPYVFQPNDIVRFKVFEKKGCDSVVLQTDVFVEEACEEVYIELTRAETKIGGIIHKPKEFWYEIELNPDTHPKTIVGYDEDGAKTFRLLPEGKDIEPGQDDEQQGMTVYEQMLEIAGIMQEYCRQAAEAAERAEDIARSLRNQK
jgi:hypothetical protein